MTSANLPMLVDLPTLSSLLGLSPASIRHHIRKGRITPIRSLGRRILFDPEQVLQEIKHGHFGPKKHFAPKLSVGHSKRNGFFENEIAEEVGFSGRRRRNE